MLAHHRGQSYLHSCLLMWIADFQYRSKTCHLQKFFDTALIGCIKGGVELEYRVRSFVERSSRNDLFRNVSKKKRWLTSRVTKKEKKKKTSTTSPLTSWVIANIMIMNLLRDQHH